MINMILIASIIPSAITAPSILLPGRVGNVPRQSTPMQPIAPPSAISGQAEGQIRRYTAEWRSHELARHIPEMENPIDKKQG